MTSQPTSAALRCLQRRSEAENAVTTAAMQWLSNCLTQSDLYEVVKQVTAHFSPFRLRYFNTACP